MFDRKAYLRKWRADNPDKIKIYEERQKPGKARYYLANKDKIKSDALVRHYGITLKEFFSILEKQNNACAICKMLYNSKTPKNFHVDHDHQTGKVRGILCNNCNRGIGLLKDDITLLEQGVKYLKEHLNEKQ